MSYIHVSVNKCSEEGLKRRNITDHSCAPEEEIDHIVNLSDIMVAIKTKYFDEELFDEVPIKDRINVYYFNIQNNFSVGQDIHVKKNRVTT